MSDQPELKAFWSRFPDLLHQPRWQQLQAQIRLMQVPAGASLFHTGDLCQHYVVVLNGSVAVRRFAENGREIVLYRVGEGQTCALTTSCLLAADPYPAEGVAETALSLMLVPSAIFSELLGLSAAFRQFVFQAFGERLSELILLVESVALRRLDIRLAERLLQLAGEGQTEIRKTHQELAAELGTAREVISRYLKEFERKGWLQTQRGNLHLLDPDQMQRFLQQSA